MDAAVLFPDAVAVVVNYLRDVLPEHDIDSQVGARVPNPRPAEFVVVYRLGGPRRNLVTDEAQLVVEAWSNSPAAAHDLSQYCRALLHGMVGNVDGTVVYEVNELAGPAFLPDPDSDQSRYTFSALVSMRGEALS